MKRFKPLPDGVADAWMGRLRGKTLDEIIALLGAPVEEGGPSNRLGTYPEGNRIAWQFTKTLRFAVKEGPVQTLVVGVLKGGGFTFEFRGEELPGTGK